MYATLEEPCEALAVALAEGRGPALKLGVALTDSALVQPVTLVGVSDICMAPPVVRETAEEETAAKVRGAASMKLTLGSTAEAMAMAAEQMATVGMTRLVAMANWPPPTAVGWLSETLYAMLEEP